MQKWLILIHIVIVSIFIGAIFGIGFGVINNTTRYEITTCGIVNYTLYTYNHFYTFCNTTIPSCAYILSKNISGACYNETNNITTSLHTTCYVLSDVYTILNITYQYNIKNTQMILTQNILYDCQNNKTCINNPVQQVTCYYDVSYPQNIVFSFINNLWIYILVLVILCLLLIFYVIINLTVFKKYNLKIH